MGLAIVQIFKLINLMVDSDVSLGANRTKTMIRMASADTRQTRGDVVKDHASSSSDGPGGAFVV